MKTALAFMLTLVSILIACGGDSDTDETAAPSPTAEPAAEIPVVEITKADEGFEAPESISGGLTRIRVYNTGTREHAVALYRFTGEGTLEQFHDALRLGATDFAASAAEIHRLTDTVGGTGSIPPGGTSEVVLDLAPGRYVMRRFGIGPPDTRALEVTSAPEVRPAPPESQFTASMVEFAYEGVPATLPAGKTTLKVVNGGEQFHNMQVRRVNEDGITAEQVRQLLHGTPQPITLTFSGAGGMGELEPGDSGWATLDLEPGVYTLICLVFDQSGGSVGKLHFELGMNHTFTVQ